MNIISITGGKGGTGKSTVAILSARDFALKGKKIVLCDCDVECPNDYLLLGVKLKKEERRIYRFFPELDKAQCQRCGTCVKSCRSNAIFQPPGGYPIFIKELCSSCGVCWNICPQKAIKKEEKAVGKIFLNKIKSNFWLITGMAVGVIEETGPIVRETKNFALKLAEKTKVDYLIIDTAAGTHCPVIAALDGVDRAICVTEPTPMGEYDLKLILKLCKELKVPAEIIINRADLGRKQGTKKIARSLNVKIVKEIPHSDEILKLYSRGKLLDLKI